MVPRLYLFTTVFEYEERLERGFQPTVEMKENISLLTWLLLVAFY